MLFRSTISVLLAAIAVTAAAQTPGPRDASRGELLYTTHCVLCHNANIHWRDQRAVKDWPSLKAQVNRWQQTSGQNWSDDDVAAVARYLNGLYYHYPPSGDGRLARDASSGNAVLATNASSASAPRGSAPGLPYP
jgi:mono/diheme cytochrome c family protein